MKIRLEENYRREEILEFIGSTGQATFFQTPCWMDVLSSSFRRFKTAYLIARSDGVIVGAMPVVKAWKGCFYSLHSLPFGTYGTPLALSGEIRVKLLKRFFEQSGSPWCVESVASLYPACETDLGADWLKVRMEECSIIRLDGTFDEYRSRGLSKKKRQICNRCENDGMMIRILDDRGEIDAFYNIYLEGSVEWGGLHPYPKKFFDELYARRDEGVLFYGAFADGELLGGHIDMQYGGMAQAWQAGMSARSHGTGAATYLVYSAVREAYAKGIKIFNLGSSGGDEGMRFFKESMGGTAHRYPVIENRKRWWNWLRRR